MTERKMASVRIVDEIISIEGAENIEIARFGGWKVIVKKGEFKQGDLAVYCEVDSFVPHTVAPFLTQADHYPKVYNGVEGQRLKTAKKMKQLSQGLALPMSVLYERMKEICGHPMGGFVEIGEDVSEILNIQKWEEPDNVGMRCGNAKGSFPHFVRKTDQERVQNINLNQYYGDTYQVSIKIDGSSTTVFYKDGEVGVCSRNVNLKEGDSRFWEVARKFNLPDKIVDIAKEFNANIAIQGELISPAIQANHEKVAEDLFYCFGIWNSDKQEYVLPQVVAEICEKHMIPHVKVIDACFPLVEGTTIEQLLEMAEGPGMNPGVKREGLVFKSLTTPNKSFKAVSNTYLLSRK